MLSNNAITNNNSQVCGIDISSCQGIEIDTLNKNTTGLTFIICKATEGITFTDKDFSHNWVTILQKGFIRGAYHFYHTDDDPIKQAQHFLSVTGIFATTDLPPIIDFEETSIAAGADKITVANDLLIFLNEVEKQTGRKPIIYTDPNIGNVYLTDSAFASYPLYIADYNTSLTQLPGAWNGKQWTLWQKNADYLIGTTYNDYDVFNGSIADLKNL
jgi:lysozyme